LNSARIGYGHNYIGRFSRKIVAKKYLSARAINVKLEKKNVDKTWKK